MGASAIQRITAFEHRLARAQATEVVELPWGFVLLQHEFPLSYDHNRVVVTAAVAAEDLLVATDGVLGAAGRRHRYVSVDDDGLGVALAAQLTAAGFEHETIVTMVHSVVEVAPSAHEVHAVSLDELLPAIIRNWQAELPEADDETLRQLADRTALYARGAELTLLAVYDGDDIAAHATLFVDRPDGIAQVENIVTHAQFRGRGYAGALVRDALRRSGQAGCDLSFLSADLHDWPHDWYARLGYMEAGCSHHFSRDG